MPIVPSGWKYKISRDKYQQFETLRQLMNRDDVSEVINACDAGREGEAIFRYIYDFFGCSYIIKSNPHIERVFKVRHTSEQTEDELSCIVGLGGTVVDVFVWHKVYGKVEAPLNIFSPMHVKQFMEGVRTGQSSELMHITGGYHYHTVRAESEAVLDRIEAALNERNYIVPEI